MSTNCEGSQLEEGYDYQFVETPSDDLICKICQYPSRNPYLTVCCGHVFCKSCLNACLAVSLNVVCPMCRSSQFQGFVNKQIDRKIRNLYVFCVNKKNGCKWKGEINDINKHLGEKCQFQGIPCPYQCQTVVRRQQMPHHMKHECVRRTIQCTYCYQFKGEFQYFETHLMNCSYTPLTCPNGCNDDTILRKDLKAHEKVCDLVQVKCKFYKMGCTAMMARKDQENHNTSNLKHHLDLVMHDRDIMASKIVDMQHHLDNVIHDRDVVASKIASVQSELARIKIANEDLHYQLVKSNKQIKTIMHNGSSENVMSVIYGGILSFFSFAVISVLMVFCLNQILA